MSAQKPDIATFIQNFESQFEEAEPGLITATTEFRQLGGWSSMQALIVIASFDWDYGVAVSAEEFRQVKTIEELHRLVNSKIS